MSAGALSVPLEDIPSCFAGIIPSSICTVSAGDVPNVTYISVVTRVEGTSRSARQFFKKTEENAAINPRAQVQVLEPATGRAFQLDLEFERTDTDGPMFERMRTKLDAVAAHEGMEQVFKLKGVDICRVLSCEMVPCDFPQGATRRDVAIERVEQGVAAVLQPVDLQRAARR